MPLPPPPPPLPPMGRGAGGPPPPPPMPGMKAPGSKPPSGAGRVCYDHAELAAKKIPKNPRAKLILIKGALLSDIASGTRLKKVTQINDRSAPNVGKANDGPSAPKAVGAPPIPGVGRPLAPSGLAPPVPGPAARVRSNSDTGGAESFMASAPQLGGLFSGGMPKLRKAGGGVDTGADHSNTPYLSDPETSQSSVLRPARASTRPLGVPPAPPPPVPAAFPSPPGVAPPVPGTRPPLNPVLSELKDSRRPSIASTISSKPKPPPPIGKKPPIPPPTSRKPSALAPPATSPTRPPPILGSPPPPPPPPPPPSSAPRSSARSTSTIPKPDDDDYDPYRFDIRAAPPIPGPPPPKAPLSNGHTPSLAEQAARNVFGRSSPAAPPPPPPSAAPAPPSSLLASTSVPPPAAAAKRRASQTPVHSMLDASSYTLTNGGTLRSKSSPNLVNGSSQKKKIIPIHDLRWRFQDESQFPRPREFINGAKKYRAGRGSSVPLDLTAFQ